MYITYAANICKIMLLSVKDQEFMVYVRRSLHIAQVMRESTNGMVANVVWLINYIAKI